MPIFKLAPCAFFKMVKIGSLGPLNPDPRARRRVGGQAQRFPGASGEIIANFVISLYSDFKKGEKRCLRASKF